MIASLLPDGPGWGFFIVGALMLLVVHCWRRR